MNRRLSMTKMPLICPARLVTRDKASQIFLLLSFRAIWKREKRPNSTSWVEKKREKSFRLNFKDGKKGSESGIGLLEAPHRRETDREKRIFFSACLREQGNEKRERWSPGDDVFSPLPLLCDGKERRKKGSSNCPFCRAHYPRCLHRHIPRRQFPLQIGRILALGSPIRSVTCCTVSSTKAQFEN